MDFALLPPEINSGRMYAGAGASPMLDAAASWTAVAAQLAASATEVAAVISGLGETWRGPSAAAMTTAATRYQAWLAATATTAERAAGQAYRAAEAYETAVAAVVLPAAITGNRARLAALVASNVFGQNTAAIMAAEAEYAGMWAQDAAAMLAYQAASSQACTLPAFTAAPPVAAGELPWIEDTVDSLISDAPYDAPLELLSLFSVLWGVEPAASQLSAIASAATTAASTSTAAPTVAAGVAARISVGAGRAVGRLTVPPAWATPPAELRSAPPVVAPAAEPPRTTPLLLSLPAGAPHGGTPPKRERPQPEYGGLVRFIPRPPSGG